MLAGTSRYDVLKLGAAAIAGVDDLMSCTIRQLVTLRRIREAVLVLRTEAIPHGLPWNWHGDAAGPHP